MKHLLFISCVMATLLCGRKAFLMTNISVKGKSLAYFTLLGTTMAQ